MHSDTSTRHHKYEYEKRYVAYIDVLGWKAATGSNKILPVIEQILNISDFHYHKSSISSKQHVQNEFGKNANPFFMGIECGIFSDGIIISKPLESGSRIANISEICRKILALGFLCRGAITCGYCYHKENRVFGPAIDEVVELEREAIFPRILCAKEIIKTFEEEPNTVYFTTDFLGAKVLNLFSPYNSIDCGIDWKEVLEIEKIEKKINDNIQGLENNLDNESRKRLEKWKYAQSLMDSQLKECGYNKIGGV